MNRNQVATIHAQSKNKVLELGLLIAQIKWLPNQLKFLKVVMLLSEVAPREDVILAVIGKEGASDIEAAYIIQKIKAIVNENDNKH